MDTSKPSMSHLLVKGEQRLFPLDGIEAHMARFYPPVMSDGIDVLPPLVSCNLNVPAERKYLKWWKLDFLRNIELLYKQAFTYILYMTNIFLEILYMHNRSFCRVVRNRQQILLLSYLLWLSSSLLEFNTIVRWCTKICNVLACEYFA